MSGRDFRDLLVRKGGLQKADVLAQKILNPNMKRAAGLKAVDYDKIKQYTEDKRRAADEAVLKMKGMEDGVHEAEKLQVIEVQSRAWFLEHEYLERERLKCQNSLERVLDNMTTIGNPGSTQQTVFARDDGLVEDYNSHNDQIEDLRIQLEEAVGALRRKVQRYKENAKANAPLLSERSLPPSRSAPSSRASTPFTPTRARQDIKKAFDDFKEIQSTELSALLKQQALLSEQAKDYASHFPELENQNLFSTAEAPPDISLPSSRNERINKDKRREEERSGWDRGPHDNVNDEDTQKDVNGNSAERAEERGLLLSSQRDRFQNDEDELAYCFATCLDNHLKVEILDEFEALDNKYLERYASLNEEYAHVIGDCSLPGGWSEDDHMLFEVIQHAYSMIGQTKLRSRTSRLIKLEHMQMCLPNHDRDDIVDHEEWSSMWLAFLRKLKEIHPLWMKERQSLMAHALRALRLSQIVALQRLQHEQEVAAFDRVRLGLHEEILKWKEAQLVEQREIERIEKEKEEQQYREEVRINALVQKKKAQTAKDLSKYRSQKQKMQEEAAQQEARYLEEFRKQKEVELKRGKERVDYRHERAEAKRREQIEREEAIMEERARAQMRLDALRATVQVTAEPSFERLIAPTASSKMHSEISVQQRKDCEAREGGMTRFLLNGFNDDRILQDKRLKVEEALRKIGLQGSEYARSILSHVAPPTIPRKDMKSTVFQQQQQQQQQHPPAN